MLRARARSAEHAADGLRAIDTGSWQGAAARAFHEKFSYEPGKWLTAADCLDAGANALDNYADTLRWAQRQAGEAIHQWNRAERATQRHKQAVADAAAHNEPPPPFSDPGADGRQAARDTLARARTQLDEAGDIATGVLRGETRPAPEESSWFEEGAEAVGDAGAAVINGVASFGNAAINNPGTVLAGLGGVAATGEASPAEAPDEITGFTEHGEQQALTRDGGRGVNDDAIYDAVENPVEPPAEQSGPKGSTYRYEGQDATVVLNGAGKVVTTWANTSEGLRNNG